MHNEVRINLVFVWTDALFGTSYTVMLHHFNLLLPHSLLVLRLRRAEWKTSIHINRVERTTLFGKFTAAVTCLRWCQNNIIRFCFVLFHANRHGLIQFVVDNFSRWQLHIIRINSASHRCALALKSLTA